MTAEGTPRRQGRTLRRWLALPLAAGFMLAGASEALAAFPGVNGKIAYTQNDDDNNEIYSVDPDGNNPTNLTNNAAADTAPDWSPDGTKIAFMSNRESPDDYKLMIMNADGSGATTVPNTLGVASSEILGVSWSPDGAKIAFDSGNRIIIINVDGSGLTPIGPTEDPDAPEWSPDGTKIVFQSDHGDHTDDEIYVMNVDGTGVTRLTTSTANDTAPDWSPDGASITWRRGTTVMTMDASGANQQSLPSTGAGTHPVFSPDGTKIAYLGSTGIHTIGADGTGDAPLLAANVRQHDWQPISPALQPIGITKLAFSQGVEGKWTWKMGKWTTSKLEQKATGPRPYTFRVLTDSHGFEPTTWKMRVRVLLNNPNDVAVPGTLADVLPGWNCSLPFPRSYDLGAGASLSATLDCSTTTDPNGPVTNTAIFTPDASTGLDQVSDQATVTIDETPPPNSPGQKVALRDPMWHNGTKVLRYLDAVNGPSSITATYTVKLIPPVTPGKCWWHHNTAHLQDVATSKKILKSNRVSVYICRPKDAPKGKDPKSLPKVGKDGIPIVTPKLGGPKVIPAKYRTRLRTRVRAPRAVFRGQAFRTVITTRNMTRKRAFGNIVKVRVPKGMRVATRQRGIRTKGRYAYWTVRALGPRKTVRRALKLVAIRPGTKRIRVTTNARNAKRSKSATRVIVRRAPRPTTR
jgi:hypothetical protein